MEKAEAHFVEGGAVDSAYYHPPTTSGAADYPTLRTVAKQADPGLTHTTPISNVTELQAMENDVTGNYYLTGDIDASATSTWNGGSGFDPVGDGTPEFAGTFDGCGYTISNLFINRSSGKIGLFGEIEDPAKIANVTLSSVNITATQGSYTGALVGACDAGSVAASDILIQNCHSSGTITIAGTTYSGVGGLVGFANGDNTSERCEIYDCSSSCTITTTTTQVSNIGGLIGLTVDALVYNCFATGDITIPSGAYSDRVGGMIGYISDGIGATDGSQVEYCYATGDIIGTDALGGLVGEATGKGYIRKCYATGDVTAHDESGAPADSLGGLVGGLINTKEVTDCYSRGDVTLDSAGQDAGGLTALCPTGCSITTSYSIGAVTPALLYVGGFTGRANEDEITFSYWDTEASGNATSDGGEGKATSWMKTKTNYIDAGWDMDTIWLMDDSVTADGYWVITAMPNAIGEMVAVVIDGVVYPDRVVADDGTVDTSDFPSSGTHIHIGMKYESKLKPMKPLSHPDMMKRLATCKQMGISVHNVDDSVDNNSITYGVHDDDMKLVNFDDPQWKNKSDIDGLFTGTVAVSVPDGFGINMPLQIITDEPLPATVRAMIPKIDVTGV